MSGINTIFFDWGGVIAGDPDDGSWSQLLKNCGASDKQAQEIENTHMQSWDGKTSRRNLSICT